MLDALLAESGNASQKLMCWYIRIRAAKGDSIGLRENPGDSFGYMAVTLSKAACRGAIGGLLYSLRNCASEELLLDIHR